jgi:hypothetical protein
MIEATQLQEPLSPFESLLDLSLRLLLRVHTDQRVENLQLIEHFVSAR